MKIINKIILFKEIILNATLTTMALFDLKKYKCSSKLIYLFLNTDRVVFPDIDQAEQNEFNL